MLLADFKITRDPLKPGERLASMLILAAMSHHGQFDKGGKPYIMHCLAVMHKLRTDDEELQCIALGHDLMEDCGITVERLRELGFTNRIIIGILALTKVAGLSYEDYKAQVKDNIDAIRVKKCDLMHNMDLRRLKGTTPKDIERSVKYMEFFVELEQAEKEWKSTASSS